MDPLLKDTPNKGHSTYNLCIKDKFCGPYRTMAIQFYLLKRTNSKIMHVVPKCPLICTLKCYTLQYVHALQYCPSLCQYSGPINTGWSLTEVTLHLTTLTHTKLMSTQQYGYQTQQVGRTQPGPTYNGHIYLYRLSFLVAGYSEHLVGPMPYCRYARAIMLDVSHQCIRQLV